MSSHITIIDSSPKTMYDESSDSRWNYCAAARCCETLVGLVNVEILVVYCVPFGSARHENNWHECWKARNMTLHLPKLHSISLTGAITLCGNAADRVLLPATQRLQNISIEPHQLPNSVKPYCDFSEWENVVQSFFNGIKQNSQLGAVKTLRVPFGQKMFESASIVSIIAEYTMDTLEELALMEIYPFELPFVRMQWVTYLDVEEVYWGDEAVSV